MKYFTLNELTRSDTAARLGIDNKPTADEYCALSMLATKVLDPCREAYGQPIMVSSGYRSVELNKAIKQASRTSQHCKGEAADLVASLIRLDRVQNRIIGGILFAQNNFDQLIFESITTDLLPAWVHVSYSRTRCRHEVLVNEQGKIGWRLPTEKEKTFLANFALSWNGDVLK